MISHLRRLGAWLAPGLLVLTIAAASPAAMLPKPKGEVILTVTGSIGVTNAPGAAEFDRDLLEGLGLSTIRTSTFWTEGPQDFEGVPLADLLAAVGADGDTIVITALNDYKVDVAVAEATQYGLLLALKRNGEYMPVREYGPLWLIYPLDQHEELQSKATANKMIWQIRSIEVR